MMAGEIFFGMFFLALALYCGLSDIAGAIRNRNLDVNFRGPITIRGEDK